MNREVDYLALATQTYLEEQNTPVITLDGLPYVQLDNLAKLMRWKDEEYRYFMSLNSDFIYPDKENEQLLFPFSMALVMFILSPFCIKQKLYKYMDEEKQKEQNIITAKV